MFSHIKEFLNLNLNDYENIGINFPLGLFLILITVAISISAFIISKRRGDRAVFLKQLSRHEAFSAESAKTLVELRISPTYFLKKMLTQSGELTSIVKRVGASTYSYEEYVKLSKSRSFKEEKIDFATAKFYISDTGRDRARGLYERESPSLARPIMLCVMLFVMLICLSFLIPELLTLLNQSLAD